MAPIFSANYRGEHLTLVNKQDCQTVFCQHEIQIFIETISQYHIHEIQIFIETLSQYNR